MPPKKGPVELPPMLGRPGNSVSAGLVGLPNVGKSTTFNVLCGMSVPAEAFPFCTIDVRPASGRRGVRVTRCAHSGACDPRVPQPTVSRVKVPDARFEVLCEKHQPVSKVPAFLTVVDIAGLVKNAHEGEGLGNAFLSHIRATDAIFHIVRVFEESMARVGAVPQAHVAHAGRAPARLQRTRACRTRRASAIRPVTSTSSAGSSA